MHQLIELGFYRRDDFRVTVTYVEYANAAREVDKAIAVRVPDFSIFSVVGERRCGACSASSDVFMF